MPGLDQAFARKLAAWTEGSGTTSDLLLVENVMERIAKPVAKSRLPLVLVLDGMSVAAGCDLAAELTDGGLWLEAGRHEDGREPVLATVPSVTSISRTSLLTGKLRSGGQPEEKAGFAAFWGNQKARLFHKGDLAADPGQRLNPQVRDAILDPDTIVGVVLNTIDDMLNPGRQGNESHWEVDQVAYLKPVLDEARRAGRPVILTADHGHVLDRGRPDPPRPVRVGPVPHRDAGRRRDHGSRPACPGSRRRSRRRRGRRHPLPAEEGGLSRWRRPGRGSGSGHRAAAVLVARPRRLASL